MHSIREELRKTGKNSWLWFADKALHISTGQTNYSVRINDGYLRITACLRTAPGAKQQSILNASLITKKVRELTAMKVNMHVGPQPDIIQLFGETQFIWKSNHITGLQQPEAVYLTESVVRFINVTDVLECNEAPDSL